LTQKEGKKKKKNIQGGKPKINMERGHGIAKKKQNKAAE